MYRHLCSSTWQTGATHTFTQKAKKRKVVTSLCASSPSPTIVGVVAPGSDSSGVVGEPSPAPLVWTRRSTTGRTAAPPVRVSTNRPRRATSAGTSEEEGSAFTIRQRSSLSGGSTESLDHDQRRTTIRLQPRSDQTRLDSHEKDQARPRAALYLPFVRRGSAPFLAPPLSLFFFLYTLSRLV